jgi:hypothetical protein
MNGVTTVRELRSLDGPALRAMDGIGAGRARLIRWALSVAERDDEQARCRESAAENVDAHEAVA